MQKKIKKMDLLHNTKHRSQFKFKIIFFTKTFIICIYKIHIQINFNWINWIKLQFNLKWKKQWFREIKIKMILYKIRHLKRIKNHFICRQAKDYSKKLVRVKVKIVLIKINIQLGHCNWFKKVIIINIINFEIKYFHL